MFMILTEINISASSLGYGGGFRKSVRSSRFHLMCSGTTDLSHSTDSTAQWMPTQRSGTVSVFNKSDQVKVNFTVLSDMLYMHTIQQKQNYSPPDPTVHQGISETTIISGV